MFPSSRHASPSPSLPPPPLGTTTAFASAISRAPSPAHPLHLPPSPNLHEHLHINTINSSSSYHHHLPPPSPGLVGGGASTTSAGPGGGGGVRSRKHASGTTTPVASSSRVDPDVTRPSLKRLTNETNKLQRNGSFNGGGGHDASSSSNDPQGKSRRSLDELGRVNKEGPAEREIIIHELKRTDTIASISLQYGITPQALRTSNRLWPSDSIHLRKTLNIPLDQCHLPSASTGIERIVREEDGNLVVWERGGVDRSQAASPVPPPPSSLAPPMASGSGSLSYMNGRSEELDRAFGGSGGGGGTGGIISPKARRLGSASAYELGGHQATSDLIGLWDGGGVGVGGTTSSTTTTSSSRTSFEDPRVGAGGGGHGRYATTNGGYHSSSTITTVNGKGKNRAYDSPIDLLSGPSISTLHDAVAAYLPSTHNPFSTASSSTTTSPPPISTLSPPPTTFSTPPLPSPTSSIGLGLSSSNPFASPTPPTGLNGTAPDKLSKRILTISRVPSSQLSFFPPSTNNPLPNPTSARSSLSEEDVAANGFLPTTMNGGGGGGGGTIGRKGSFFGPLANSLARLNLSPTESWTSGEASIAAGVGSGAGGGAKTAAGGTSSWKKRWDLSYFGEEGDVEFSQVESWRLPRSREGSRNVSGGQGGGGQGGGGGGKGQKLQGYKD